MTGSQPSLVEALEGALDALDRAQELVSHALTATKQGSANEPIPAQVTLTGKIGRPKFETKGDKFFWSAGLQIAGEDGQKEWVNLEAWRQTAEFARDNVERAQVVTLVGKWRVNSWTDDAGKTREERIFKVDYFKQEGA